MLDGYVASWDKLPVLPDIKLAEGQYKEIKGLVEKGETVELEFDIRNWFKMGPVKYHSVVATLRGSEFPDEYIVLGGHFDCFSAATGAVDDGSGFAPAMEAVRLIQAAGGRPKRSIVVILFAAEEIGLVGSQAWLKNRPEIAPKIVMMINRDGSPSAITGAAVPETWLADFKKITAPLAAVNPKWPFKLERGVPRAHATSPGGSDHTSFEMLGVPTLRFMTQTDYRYKHAWHTLHDLYSELVPYTAHQQHSALVTAVVAYGAANLDKPLTRGRASIWPTASTPTSPWGPPRRPYHIMTTLDFVNAPLQTANFVRIVEGKGGGQRRGRAAAWDRAVRPGGSAAGGPADRQGRRAGRRHRRARRLGRPEVGGHPEPAAHPQRRAQARRRRRPRRLRPERVLPDPQEAGRAGQDGHGHRQDDRRARPAEDREEGRRHPHHPHRPGGPGRARLQDGRRGLQEAAGGVQIGAALGPEEN